MNKAILLSSFIFIVFTLLQFTTLSPREDLRVYFLDVGQGDAILIQYPTGERLLIDTGKDSKLFRELDTVMPWYDKTIDYVLLTHGDIDHTGAMDVLLDRYVVKKLFVHEFFDDGFEGVEKYIIEKAKQNNVDIEILTKGDVLTFGTITPNAFKILHPNSNCMIIFNSKNECSLVGILTYGEDTFLFMGDVGKKVEQELLAHLDTEITILKVGHHGSKNSTDEEFISKIKPQYSVISVGENSYGHPTREVLDILEKNNSTIFTTKETATIVAVSNGIDVEVKSLFDQAGFFQSSVCTILLYGFDTSC